MRYLKSIIVLILMLLPSFGSMDAMGLRKSEGINLDTDRFRIMEDMQDCVPCPIVIDPARSVTENDKDYSVYEWTSLIGEMRNEKVRYYGYRIRRSGSDTIVLTNFMFPYHRIEMIVNQETRKVRVRNRQYVGSVKHSSDEKIDSVFLLTVKYSKIDQNIYFTAVDELEGTLQDNGDISFGSDAMLGSATATQLAEMVDGYGSYLKAGIGMTIRKQPFLTPEREDFSYVGEGVFADGWLNPLLTHNGIIPVEEQKVDILVSKSNPNLLAVENPYKAEAWGNVPMFEREAEGYILIDISTRWAVMVLPLVHSGMEMKSSESEQSNPLYVYNVEGYNWFFYGCNEPYFDPLWYRVRGNKKSPKDMDFVHSILQGDTIFLTNLWFSDDKDPVYPKWWWSTGNDQEDMMLRSAIIKLPKGWDAGVKGIGAGDPDAPARYYSLQGVELLEPTRGMPVIEVKNGRSRKVMIR